MVFSNSSEAGDKIVVVSSRNHYALSFPSHRVLNHALVKSELDYLTSDKKIRLLTVQRKRFKEELLIGAPPGSIVTISDTGHINSELFVRWLNYFIETVKPSPEATVLLLLDGHSTHSKNLRALRIARENGISASTSYQESQQEASSSEEDNLTLAQIASRTKRAEPTSQNVSVHEISPLPISKSQSSKISRNQDAVELTSFPYKN
ncbi:hypothetical protein HUJ04_006909 [Dendroctonus ponderosae]|nr:hypothetical protein HUJ04_006909 [Dendroctonus ponderosae]